MYVDNPEWCDVPVVVVETGEAYRKLTFVQKRPRVLVLRTRVVHTRVVHTTPACASPWRHPQVISSVEIGAGGEAQRAQHNMV